MAPHAKTGPTYLRHVFLDLDNVTEWDVGVFQTFPQAEKVPITGVEPGPPGAWDARVANYANVLYEDGRYRMWYCCQPEPAGYGENADHFYTCYAESDDGIAWKKPDLKITGQQRWPGNNLLALPGAVQSVVYGLPASRYRYLAVVIQIREPEPGIDGPGARDERGTIVWGSNDGFAWERVTKVCQHGDNMTLFTDVDQGRYLLYQKVGLMHGLAMRRSLIGMESKDGEHWEGYGGFCKWRECFVADDYDDLLAAQRGRRITDFYGVSIHKVGGLYIAIQNVHTICNPLKQAFGQNPWGFSHFRLLFSHDGFHWRYPVGRPAWLESGGPGSFDAGFMAPGLNILEKGDTVLNYYSGAPFMHGWCIDQNFAFVKDIPLEAQRKTWRIGLARIKRDRYASLAATFRSRFTVMDPDAIGADPLVVDPGSPGLCVNAKCLNGYVKAALVKQGEKTSLPGFGFDDCEPFTGDAVRASLRFKKALTDIPAGTPLYLRFEMQNCELFAFEWNCPTAKL